MTAKQKRFCDEYLVDLNATQAAIRAGYSATSANQIGTENLAKPCIRACIDKALAEQSKRTGVNADRVVRELARIAFVKADDVISMTDATIKPDASRDDLAAIASVKVKQTYGDYEGIEREVKLCDKIKALELLGRRLGMFTDNINLSGDLGVQLIDDIPKSAG